MANRIYLPPAAHATIKSAVREFGLRPVVDSVGAAARELLQDGVPVLDEHGEPMDADDIETAAENLVSGDLY